MEIKKEGHKAADAAEYEPKKSLLFICVSKYLPNDH